MASIHKAPDRSGAKSASAALDELLTKSPTTKDTRKTKSAKSAKGSGKKKKGKKKSGSPKKKKAPAVSWEQVKSPAAMSNAYYICHNAPDFLFVRGFKFKPKSAWETVPPAIRMRLLGTCN